MALVALENYQTGLVWQVMGRDPVILRAFCIVFKSCAYLPVILKS